MQGVLIDLELQDVQQMQSLEMTGVSPGRAFIWRSAEPQTPIAQRTAVWGRSLGSPRTQRGRFRFFLAFYHAAARFCKLLNTLVKVSNYNYLHVLVHQPSNPIRVSPMAKAQLITVPLITLLLGPTSSIPKIIN